ncbi:MAG TPA: amidohydrolase family protein [Acetobacteraceae bacterium]|nr:amidohydrolase family protein [Acetobacteraceae bacterium]
MPSITCIRNAACIIAWDAASRRHAYLMDGDVAFSGDAITFVGRHYDGVADTTIDGRELMVMPGLIDLHSHPSTEPFYRGVREEHGVPAMYMSGLYERSVAFRPDLAGRKAGKEVAYCEMLLSGVTGVADLSGNDEGWIELAAQSGLRVFLAPGYASSRWYMDNGWQLKYRWDEAAGRRGLDAALELIEQAGRHPSGRLSGIVCPAQIDTCTPDLLRDSFAAAQDKDLPLTVHCSQSVNEFNEMVSRHGKTPVQFARDLGMLAPRTILGHAIFIDEHSWVRWHTHADLQTLADTGTNVAHCPSPFARYGQTLEDFGRYRRAGVNLGLGTDVAPHNLIEEMRLAAILARVAARDITTTSTAALFHAATVGGADALGRPDLGRLAPGMKADLVLVDLANTWMRPARDPLRSLVFTAADRAVQTVYVHGAKVVEQGRVLTMDHAGALAAVAEGQQRMLRDAPSHDWAGRQAEEIAPLSLPVWN